MKMRPYGGLIRIDNIFLDKYFKSYKILRLRAILHDALGFVFEYSEKEPGYSYVLPCPETNDYLGHVTGLAFCLYVKTFKSNLFSLLECLIHGQLFLTLKAFDIKTLVLLYQRTSCFDRKLLRNCVILPPTSFNIISSSDRRS